MVVVNPEDAVTPGGVSLASFRPTVRPGGLAPEAPRSLVADPALAGFRPNVRPQDLAPDDIAEMEEEPEPDLGAVLASIAEAAPETSFENVSDRAIRVSARPDPRPRNFAQVVSTAQSRMASTQRTVVAAAPAPAPARAAPAAAAPAPAAAAPAQPVSNAAARPTGPVPGSVAQAATQSNALGLREVSLIGVYGRPNARRALVRLGNGQFVKVQIGSSLDGGQVTAINDSALNYVKRGRTYALQIPRG